MRRDRSVAGCLIRSLAGLVLLCGMARAEARNVTASTALYVRTDSDHTTVVSPRLRASAALDPDTRIDLVYTADVWSSASIDIRSAATKRVIEQRDELALSLERSFSDLTLGGSYRYSIEHDYESHGGSLGASYDLAQRATTLAATLRATLDRIERAGDPRFMREASLLSARVACTQLIDPNMLVQLTYELASHRGYLASPYRFVRIADSQGAAPGTCVGASTICARENDPAARLRHALVFNARRALGEHFSLATSYRYYFDDWQLRSHTASFEATVMYGDWLFALEYRFYRQSAAAHYKPYYPLDPLPSLRTSDKELSALTAHRVGVEVAHSWLLDTHDTQLKAVLRAAPSYFSYDGVPWLRAIQALESSVALELVL